LCPAYRTVEPDPTAAAVYDRLYGLYRKLYCGFGSPDAGAVMAGDVLPALRKIAAEVRAAG
jgi:L-ribulokinase